MSAGIAQPSTLDHVLANIRAVRALRNMSLKDFADAVGVSTCTAHNWGAGKAVPSLSMLDRIAAALDVTVEQLIARPPYVSAA